MGFERDDAPEQRLDKRGALREQIASLSVHRPLLMVFEDAHWMDPTSQELLHLVIERVQQRKKDRHVLHGSLPPLAIPTTIQASLMTRLDQ